MTQNCQTFDQSSSQTGWSGQNAQTSTAYTSGTQGVYTVQTALTMGTTYYWRSYAIDPGGSNTFGSTQTTPRSFTTIPSTAPTPCGVVKNATDTTITLNWTDTYSTETGYQVKRSVDGGAFSLLTTTAANVSTYPDSTVSDGHTYQYQVREIETNNQSEYCTTSTLSLGLGNLRIN